MQGNELGIGFIIITVMYLIYGVFSLWYAYYIGVKKVFLMLGEMTPELDARIKTEVSLPRVCLALCGDRDLFTSFVRCGVDYL